MQEDRDGAGRPKIPEAPSSTPPRKPRLAGRRSPSVSQPSPTPVGPAPLRRDRVAPPQRVPAPVREPLFAEQRIERMNRLAGRILTVLAPVVVVAFVVLRTFIFAPPSLNSDAANQAQIARHIARGDGYRTSVVNPLAAGLGFPMESMPELAKPPVFPYIVAALQSIRDYTDGLVLKCSCLGLFLCLGALYWTGVRLFGWKVGLLAVALMVFNPRILSLTTSGTHTSWAAAWVICAVVASTFISETHPRQSTSPAPRVSKVLLGSLGVGVLLGLAYLTEYSLLLLPIPFLLYARQVVGPSRRRQAMVLLLIGFLVVAGPWWAKTMRVWGAPVVSMDRYASLLWTEQYPGTTALRMVDLSEDPYLFLLRHPRAALVNVFRCGAGLCESLPTVIGPLILAGVALLYLTSLKSESEAPWRRLLMGGFIALVVAMAVTSPFKVVKYVPLFPLAALLAALAFARVLRLARAWQKWMAGMGLGLVLLASVLMQEPVSSPTTQPTIQNLVLLSQQLPEDVVIVTDAPQLVAWYLDRTAVWLPARPSDLQVVTAKASVSPVLFLSRNLIQQPASEEMGFYQRILLSSDPPEGFQEVALPLPGDKLIVPRAGDESSND